MASQESFRLENFIPALAEAITLHDTGDDRYVLRDGLRMAYIELSSDEAAITSLMDGKTTAEEIFIYSYERHKKVPLATLITLLRKLAASGFLANSNEELETLGLIGEEDFLAFKPSLWDKLTRWGFYSRHNSGFGTAITNPLIGVFALAVTAFLGVFGFIERQGGGVLEKGGEEFSFFYGFILLILAFSFAKSFQEIVKGSAMALSGAPSGRCGLAFFFIIPYFACDQRDKVICHKLGRSMIAISGMASLLALVLLGVTLEMRSEAELARFGYMLSIISAILLLLDMSPFFGGDFGDLISSAAGGEQWRKKALSYLRYKFLVRLFTLGDAFKGEKLFISLGVYAIVWLYLFVLVVISVYKNFGSLWLSSFYGAEGLDKFAIIIGLSLLALAAVLGALTLIGAFIAALSSPIVSPWRRIAMNPKARAVQDIEHDEDSVSALSKAPLFTTLSDIELSALAEVVKKEKFNEGDFIIRQGDIGDKFYIIKKGRVEVIYEDDTGDMKKVAELKAGDCFGEIALLTESPRTAHVKAAQETELLSLEREVLKDFARAHNLSAETFTELLRRSQFLKEIGLFKDMTAEVHMELSRSLKPEKFRVGEDVVVEGEAGDKFYIIQDGVVEVLKGEGEEEKKLAELGSGDYFGEIALIKNMPRTATVRAKKEVRLMSLAKSEFIHILGKDFRLAAGLDRVSEERLTEANVNDD